MARKKREPSFDAIIRLFIQKYGIATKQEINHLIRKVENLEKELSKISGNKSPSSGTTIGRSASEVVFNVIKDFRQVGISVAEIKEQTGYEDKKVRNILNRLYKENRIKRKKRGVYSAA